MVKVGEAASAAVEPEDDIHASAPYRRSLAGTMAERALKAARRERAGAASPRQSGAGEGGNQESRARVSVVRVALARGRWRHAGASHDTKFEVNGKQVERRVEPRMTLADCLRHDLRLTGTHVGCEHGVCGACTVLVDGAAVRSCLMLAVQAEGARSSPSRACRRTRI